MFLVAEGTLRIRRFNDNKISLTYSSIDDIATKYLSVEDLMDILGYKLKKGINIINE
jgi:hypothetical protein